MSVRNVYHGIEPYTDKSEALLEEWLETSAVNAEAHYKKGKYFKWMHEVFGLPATLLPILFTPISGSLSDRPGIQYANLGVLALTGVLSGIHNFFDYARKSQRHFEYEAKYADLYTTIQVELTKERELRIRADRFVEMVQSDIDHLRASAPLL